MARRREGTRGAGVAVSVEQSCVAEGAVPTALPLLVSSACEPGAPPTTHASSSGRRPPPCAAPPRLPAARVELLHGLPRIPGVAPSTPSWARGGGGYSTGKVVAASLTAASAAAEDSRSARRRTTSELLQRRGDPPGRAVDEGK
jgi:hypothetical protein